MANVFNPLDVYVIQRNVSSSSFEEMVLSSHPRSLVYFDSFSRLTSLTSSQTSNDYPFTASYALSASVSIANFVTHSTTQTTVISASWASSSISSSYSIFSDTSSISLSSSYAISSNTASSINFIPQQAVSSSILISGNSASIFIDNSGIIHFKNLISTADYANTNQAGATNPNTFNVNNLKIGSFSPTNNIVILSDSNGNILLSSTDIIHLNYINTLSSSVQEQIDKALSILVTGSLYSITSSWANNSTTASYSIFAQTSPATTLFTGSIYLITSSWSNNSITASFALSSPATTLNTASTYSITSSWANNSITTSFAQSSPATTLNTGSTYSITSSWANNSTTSSYSPVEPTYSASVSTQFGTKQPNLVVGNSYTITSSWASNSISSSWSPNQGATTLNTGSTYPITSSWANNSISASFGSSALTASFLPIGTYQITSSWANNSTTASFAQNSPATTLNTGSTYQITSSQSVSSSWSPNQGATTLFTASTYQITSSWATNAINGGTQLNTGSIYPVTSSWSINSLTSNTSTSSISSSWASSSISTSYSTFAQSSPATTLFTASTYQITSSWSTFAQTASFSIVTQVTQSTTTGSISSSWASSSYTSSYSIFALTSSATTLNTGSTYFITSSWSVSSSWSPNQGATTLNTGSNYFITSSWASNSISSSFAATYPRELSTGSTYQITSSWSTNSNSSSIFTSSANTLFLFDLSTGSGGNQPTYVDVDLTYNPSTNQISGSNIGITASLSGTSSFSTNSGNSSTASWALASPATTLGTSSTYPITSSWAQNSISSSFSTTSSFALNSGNNLITASTVPITSSWALNILTASFALTSGVTVSGSALLTGSLVPITSSWAVNANSSSVVVTSTNTLFYFDLSTGSTGYQPTYVNTSVTFNPSTNQISGSNLGITASLSGTSSFSNNAISASWAVSSNTASFLSVGTYTITSSQSVTSSFALTSPATTLNTGSTYPITSSWATKVNTGDIIIGSPTASMILWDQVGVSAPTVDSRSIGTKLVLYPNIGSGLTDYAIGINAGTLWYTVPNVSSIHSWYGGTSSMMALSSGDLVVSRSIFAPTINSPQFVGQFTGTSSWASNVSAGTIISSYTLLDGVDITSGSLYFGKEQKNNTSLTAGSLRNNFNGYLGYQFTIGTSPVIVTRLGLYNVTASNTGSHIVKMAKSIGGGNSSDVASVNINLTGNTVGQFNYVQLTSPLYLSSSTTYFFAAQEANGGDFWLNNNTVFTSSAGISKITSSNSADGQTGWVASTINTQYVGLDFFYIISGSNITVSSEGQFILSSTAGTVSSSITVGNITSSFLLGTSSWANNSTTSSFSLTSLATTLNTGSTYQITSSQAVSASWSPGSNPATTLNTGSTYFITSSWAVNAINGGTQLNTGSTYPITSSWALSSISSSYAFASTVSDLSNFANFANLANSASFAPGSVPGTTLFTASIYQITSSWANNTVLSISSSFASKSISSSYSQTASFALNAGGGGGSNLLTGSLVPITSSWANNSTTSSFTVFSSTANTANFATFAGTSNTASFLPVGTYAITSSWATKASFAPVIFTNTQIVNGQLLILSDLGTGSWYALTVHDDGSGSYTTQLTPTTNTGSFYASSSVFVTTSSLQITSSISASWASSSYTSSFLLGTASWASNVISSSYAVTASFALNGGGSGGGSNLITGSLVPITSSWAINALTASTSLTASTLLNNYVGFLTDLTSSTNWVTISLAQANQQVNLTNAGAYNFTQSGVPAVGQIADIILFISHSAAATSSLIFPSSWKNIGGGWPTAINSNTVAVVWLRGIDTSSVIGTYNVSGSQSSASYAQTASWAVNVINAQTGSGTSLNTGSIYFITSSWANNAITASFSLNGSGGSNLITGSLVPITASQAVSASFAPGSSAANYTSSLFGTASWAVNVINAQTGSGTSLSTGSIYFITSSWANNAIGTPTVTVTAAPFSANNQGGTDTTTAIQSAINSITSSGGVVFFPAGNYKISGTINLYRGVSLVGETAFESSLGSQLRRVGGSTGSMINISGSGGNQVSLRNLNFNGQNQSSSLALNIFSASIFDVDHCSFVQLGTAVKARYSWDGTFNCCILEVNTCSFDFQNAISDVIIRNGVMNSNVFVISASTNFNGDTPCMTLNVENNDIETNTNGILLTPNIYNCNIKNNHFEGNINYDIWISGSVKTGINSNTFTGNNTTFNIVASQSLDTSIRDNAFVNLGPLNLLLDSNQYIQRNGNSYTDENLPSISESRSTFYVINDYKTSSFANNIIGTSSWAVNVINAQTGSGTSLSTGSVYFITSSWATSSITASTLLNNNSSYSTITTSSTLWITASFTGTPTQKIILPQTASYSITASGIPAPSGTTSDILLYFSHSAASGTSSLSWPANWVCLTSGSRFPTQISASKLYISWLRTDDLGVVMGTFSS